MRPRLVVIIGIITLFVLVGLQPVYAATATVKVSVKTQAGEPIVNHEISCTDTPPQEGTIPPAPTFTYLRTDSQGIAYWTPQVQEGHKYKCTTRTGTTLPDYCYSIGSPSPSGDFSLSEGEIKEISMIGTYLPNSCKTGSGSTPKETGTTTPQEPQPPALAPIAESTLPEIFTQEGSSTTDIKTLTQDQATKVENFTIEIVGVGKVVFQEPLDLSSEDLKEKFETLDTYINITRCSIYADTEAIPAFAKKAQVTLYHLRLKEGSTPIIVGKAQDSPDSVKNIFYEDTVLTFDVDLLSTYVITPTMTLEPIPETTNEPSVTLKGMIDDLDARIIVSFQGQDIPVTPDEVGVFLQILPLQEGENNISISVQSTCTTSEEHKYTITYTPEQERASLLILTIIIVTAIALIGISGGVFCLIKRKKS